MDFPEPEERRRKKWVMLLGATGATGVKCLSYFIRATSFPVICVGRNMKRLTELLDVDPPALPADRDPRIELACLDVKDAIEPASSARAEFVKLLKTKVRVVCCVLPDLPAIVPLARIVIENQCDWIDAHFTTLERLQQLGDAIEKNQCCVVTHGGFHPGLIAPAVRLVMEKLPTAREVYVGSMIRQPAGFEDSASSVELVKAFQNFGKYQMAVRKGLYQKVRHYSRSFDYEFGAGKLTSFIFGLPELGIVCREFPSIVTSGFYVTGFSFFSDYVAAPLIMLSKYLPLLSKRRLGSFLAWSSRGSGGPHGVVFQVEARSETEKFVVAWKHREMNSAFDLTAAPMVATVQQMYYDDAKEWRSVAPPPDAAAAETAREEGEGEEEGERSEEVTVAPAAAVAAAPVGCGEKENRGKRIWSPGLHLQGLFVDHNRMFRQLRRMGCRQISYRQAISKKGKLS